MVGPAGVSGKNSKGIITGDRVTMLLGNLPPQVSPLQFGVEVHRIAVQLSKCADDSFRPFVEKVFRQWAVEAVGDFCSGDLVAGHRAFLSLGLRVTAADDLYSKFSAGKIQSRYQTIFNAVLLEVPALDPTIDDFSLLLSSRIFD